MEKDHLEIILEDMNSKFDIVIEGYSTLDRKIDDLAKKTKERFDLVDLKFEVLNNRIDGVEDRLDKKIDSVNENLSKKIDSVVSDLKAHRQYTEAHHSVYRVKES